jgi:predicted CopG family antitoxin
VPTTIQISDENHQRLKERKVVDREPFNDVVERLLDDTADEDG